MPAQHHQTLFDQIYLEGDARIIYTGELQPDAFK
jgi:hypothetical protein